MPRFPRYSSVVALALAVIACQPAEIPDDTADAPPPRPVLRLANLPTERVSARTGIQTEWRDAVRVESVASVRLDLGPANDPAFVRMGLLDTSGSPITLDLAAGDTRIDSIQSSGAGTWQDFRIPLAGLPVGAPHVHAELTSAAPYFVSTAEVVTGSSSPPVIVVLVDTLRKDHLGCYGYDRPTSPNIDAFSADAIRFDHLVPASSWTRPSVASLLTSTVPGVHGGEDIADHLREDLPWIGSAFQQAGYETQAFMTNPNCVPLWGFGGGFSRLADLGAEHWLEQDDRDVMQRAANAVRDAQGRPFFLYVHAMAPHEPYTPPEPHRAAFDRGDTGDPHSADIDLYDAEVRYFDTLFGEFVGLLKETGVYDDAIVVLLSDHGQAFGEHGDIGHGSSLYEEQMNPPLIVRLPSGRHAGEVRSSLVEMIDIAPTIAALAGVAPDPRFQGRSMLPLIDDGAWDKSVAFASLQHREFSQYMSRTLGEKFIQDVVTPRELWFDLAADPRELSPLATPPADADALRTHIAQMTALGRSGLHILVTHDSSRPLEVTGEIAAAGLADVRLDYPADRATIESGPGNASFRAAMPEAKPGENGSARRAEALDASETMRKIELINRAPVTIEQDHVLFTAQVPQDAAVNVRVALDGIPVETSLVNFGAARPAQTLDGAAIVMNDVVGSSIEFDPAALPVATAVYVWFVPSPEQVFGDQLSPELRESLDALGYGDN